MAPPSLSTVVQHLRAITAEPATDRELLERFARRRDEAAFAEIVRRHAALVHGVCRRLLGNHHDAEDAFQATFLVLASKAGSGPWEASLGGWLYRVAYQIARKAHASMTRRRLREQKAARRERRSAEPEVGIRDISALLDDGLQALDRPYRDALIRCCLEGQTRQQAACQLGLSQRTLERRLARGKLLLKHWLARRGVTVSAALLASALSKDASASALADRVICSTALAAREFAAGTAISGGSVSAKAAAWAQAVLKGFTALKASALAAGIAALCAGGWLARGALVPHDGPLPLSGPALAASAAAPVEQRAPRLDASGEPLPSDAISRLGSLQMRHGDFTDFVRFAPNGKALVSHGGDGVRIWDATNGKLLLSLPRAFTGAGYRPSLSADGQLLLTPSASGSRLWEVATGRLIRQVSNQDCFVARLSPDAQRLVTRADSNFQTIVLLDAATGAVLWSYSSGGEPWSNLDFAPSGREVVVSGWGMLQSPPLTGNSIRFLDVATGRETRRIDLGTVPPRAFALSPRGDRLAVLGYFDPADYLQTDLRVWDLATRKLITRIVPPTEPGRQRYFSALTFTPDGQSVVTAGSQDGLVVWDTATGKERARLGHGFTNSYDVTFAPDGKSLAAAAGSIIRTLAWPTGRDLLPSASALDYLYATAISPDRKTIIAAGGGPRWVSFDLSTGRERWRFAHGTGLGSVGLTGDGRLAWSVPHRSKTVTIWDVEGRRPLHQFTASGISGTLGLCCLTPDGRNLALSSWLGDHIDLVDWKTGMVSRSIPSTGKISFAAFTADSRTMFVFREDHLVQVWDVTKGMELRHFGPLGDPSPITCGTPRPYQAIISPDGGTLFYWSYNSVLRLGGYTALLVDGSTGRVLRPAADRWREPPEAARFSPDGRMLACANEDGYGIHLIEVRSGKDRRILAGHRGPVRSLTFSDDGRLLVSASADTTALVWDLTGQTEAAGREGSLTPAQLTDGWNALCSADAARAYRAIQTLAGAPSSSIPFLTARLRTDGNAGAQRLDQLIADLSSDHFRTRENALGELMKVGPAGVSRAEEALATEQHPEARIRLARFLEAHRLPVLRAIEALELAATPEAESLLESLARGPRESPTAQDARDALQRLRHRHSRSLLRIDEPQSSREMDSVPVPIRAATPDRPE